MAGAVGGGGAAINPSIEHAKSQYFIELNQALLTDLENQMSEFLALDTDLARASAADIRVQISITKSLIGFGEMSLHSGSLKLMKIKRIFHKQINLLLVLVNKTVLRLKIFTKTPALLGVF